MAVSDGGIVLEPGAGTALAGSTGAHFVMKAGTAETRGAYSFIEATVPSGLTAPRAHIHHEHEEVFYVLDGAVAIRLGDRTVTAGAGTFVLVPRGVIHTYANPGTGTARFITIGSPAGLEGLFQALREAAAGGLPDDDTITSLGRRFDTEYLARQPGP